MSLEFLLDSLADRISKDYISGKGDLSKLVAEAAKVNNMNDETIKRLIEFTNHAVFRKLFEAKAAAKATDRNIEFDVADFDKVKEILDDFEEESSESKSESLSESDILDRYPDLSNAPLGSGVGSVVSDLVKSVLDKVKEQPGEKNIHIRIIAIKKASDEAGALFEKLKHDYNETLQELATEFCRFNAYDLNKFASEVFAVSKDQRVDGNVLADIYTLCRETPAKMKVAEDKYINLPRKEYELFKKATDIFRKLEAVEQLKEKLDKVLKSLNG